MRYSTTMRGETFTFADLREVFARANEARDRSMGIGVIDDPYPTYHAARAACPVGSGALSRAFGFDGTDAMLHPDREHVTVYSYPLVEAVLKDTTTFSSAWYDPQLVPSIGRSILHMDPPEHERHRLVVTAAFSRREMQSSFTPAGASCGARTTPSTTPAVPVSA